MKQMVKIIRRVDISKQYEHILKLELDYMLSSLYEAMTNEDNEHKAKCIKRLKEIKSELDGLQAYA